MHFLFCFILQTFCIIFGFKQYSTYLINVLFLSENDPPQLLLSTERLDVIVGEQVSVKVSCTDPSGNQQVIISYTGNKGDYNAASGIFIYTVKDYSPLSAS